VDVQRLYSGVWREIGRTPMKITDGCVAGTTTYTPRPNGDIAVVDDCRIGSPAGRRKAIAGTGRILDPGTNATLRVRYRVFGVLPLTWDYQVLDHADDYSWFIAADPGLTRLFIFARDAPMAPDLRERLTRRAQALGYDTRRLEFPAQPPG
jgi:apolipoprotein D and lipocalin family protein